jgi:hypothetical protein
MTLSDWNLICLPRIAHSRCHYPNSNDSRGNPAIVPAAIHKNRFKGNRQLRRPHLISRRGLFRIFRSSYGAVAIVTGETHPPHTKSMSLWSERILVVLPDGHRLAANEIVHWTDLKGEALLLSRRDPQTGQKWCDMI